VTPADAISVIVVIMRHMRFLFSSYDQQKPDKDLTEEVRGLFPRVAKKLKYLYSVPRWGVESSHRTGGRTRARIGVR
jgi:hypothetical protein